MFGFRKQSEPREVIKEKLVFGNTELVEMMEWALKEGVEISTRTSWKDEREIRLWYYKSSLETVSYYHTIGDEEPLVALIDSLIEVKKRIKNRKWN